MPDKTPPKMPPVDRTPNVNTESFELINCLQSFDSIPVYEYSSKNTGLTVFIAEVEGPIVDGFFCLATETFDDDGLPHTLEHLIFLGSEQFPYKGILDLLANRCLASGTNAWTDIDHTCYTMETAGSEGFMSLLPIFLDHILYPILTESGYITEVHHITPKGDDAGVVYCEMQGRENSAESRLHLNLSRAIYPGHCGYSSETGGILKNLRESTDNKKVTDFHKKFYRPENLKLIITGKVNHDHVFKALEQIEQKILAKGGRSQFQRPWQNPVPPMESKDLIIKFPTDEENNGVFGIGWRGPSSANEQYLLLAVNILFKYLTEFPTYTLPQEFVEIDEPYASHISFNVMENSSSCIYITFNGVPLGKLPEIKPKLEDLFKRILEKEDINMNRIASVIVRTRLEYYSNLENQPHNTMAFILLGQILYGNTKEDFQQRLNPVGSLSSLTREPKSFWLKLVKNYLVDNKYVAIQCVPSKEEFVRMSEEEAHRVKLQIEKLGEEGLKNKTKVLEDAISFNDREPSPEVLTSVPIPDISSVRFHNISRYRTDCPNLELLDLRNTNVYTRFDHVKSEFCYIYAMMDTSEVPAKLRVYIPLLLETLFESPIVRNGQIISFSEVVEELNNDTVNYGATLGLRSNSLFECGPFSNYVCVNLQVEWAKYTRGVKWLQEIIYGVVFTPERLKIVANKMNNAVAETKRSGRTVVRYAINGLRYTGDSNVQNNGIIRQNKFLTETIEKLSGSDGGEVVETCQKIWELLTAPKNINLHLAANLEMLEDAKEPLEHFVPSLISPVQKRIDAIPDRKLLKPLSDIPMQGCVIGMGCLESSFFIQTIESINSHDDGDLPALLLFIQYLIQAEGPLWKEVRGKGFSYHYRIKVEPDNGLLYLVFSKATNVVGAYMATRDIILKQANRKQREWDNNLIESAKSSLIFELIDVEKTIGSVIGLSIISYFQNIDFTYNRKLLNSIQSVTTKDLDDVGEKYILPLFDPKQVKTAIVTAPGKVEQIQQAFRRVNIELNTYSTLEESFLGVV